MTLVFVFLISISFFDLASALSRDRKGLVSTLSRERKDLVSTLSRERTVCSINLNEDLPKKNSPLILKNDGNKRTLVVPEGDEGVIELKDSDEILLSCPGTANTLRAVNKANVKANCLSNAKLWVNDSKVHVELEMKNAGCAKQYNAIVKNTDNECAQTGKLYEIGFQAQGWHPIITVCHDKSESNTFYSQHTLHGSALRGAQDGSGRKYNAGKLYGFYEGFNPNTYYKGKSQANLFRTVVGSEKASKYYKMGDKLLSRGHLAPRADFIFKTWKFAADFYINVAPQWQWINRKNWVTVENLVRKLAKEVGDDFIVVTGTYGILELEDDEGNLQKIYLNNEINHIPAPLYYWKVVYHPNSQIGIAFVTSNNPYVKSGSEISLCDDICDSNGWTNWITAAKFQDVSRGSTICCTVDDLRETVPYVPAYDVRGELQGPNEN